MTVQQVISHIGGNPIPVTGADQFHAGGADAEVKAVAVTFQATRAILHEALRLGANLIVTHEPTYYTDGDPCQQFGDDPIYLSKREFIEKSRLTIWRCHDWWHRTRPDGILTGVASQLDWLKYRDPQTQYLFNLPATNLEALARDLKVKLGISSLRIIGDAAMPVRRVGLSCGCPGWDRHRRMLRTAGVDVLVCGEQREWETCEYVRDSAAAGLPQGLIVLGHCNSEEGGMAYLADWLRQRVHDVPIYFVPAGDPFRYV